MTVTAFSDSQMFWNTRSNSTWGQIIWICSGNVKHNKGPSIYDVHKNQVFDPLPPVYMRPHDPDPLVDVHMRST